MLACYSPTTVHDLTNPHYKDFDYFSHSSYQPDTPSFSSASSPSLLLPTEWMSTQSTQQQHPSIRVQRSSPFDQSAQKQMLAQQYPGGHWGSNAGYLNPSSFAQAGGPQQRFGGAQQHHKRASSASSVTSAGPPSPQDTTTSYPRIANGDSGHYSPSAFDSLDIFATGRGTQMPKSLPTPADTPTQNTFNPSEYQQYKSPQSGMRRIPQNRSPKNDEDGTTYNSYSGAHSVSSMSHHNSPATPQTASYDGEFGDAAKNLQHAGFHPQVNIPTGLVPSNFDDYYNNHLQNVTPQQQAQLIARAGGNSPFKASLANRFHAAQIDHVVSRSGSPALSIQRERSPFRPGSTFEQTPQMPPMAGQRLGPPQMTPLQYQQQQQNVQTGPVVPQQRPQQQQPEQPKTVSPKDVELEYHEDNQTPLFPSSQQSQYSLPREESNFSTTSNFGQPNQFYASVPSSTPQAQQFPFLGQQSRRQQTSLRSGEQLPDFPAHLASMETTASSDGGPDIPSTAQIQRSMAVSRPADTSADVGTYPCTEPGCSHRFGSSIQLHKHRREAHRQVSPAQVAIPTDSTANQSHVSSAAAIASRNAQTGPHRCERINPTTGKPCNSVFSRPYDLTRHEDTIHTGRKHKVRCHLCTEEKTFSRNDALTRHMRVVHPEVDWPGKTRRKGRD